MSLPQITTQTCSVMLWHILELIQFLQKLGMQRKKWATNTPSDISCHDLNWQKLHSQTHIFCTNKSTHQPERETFPSTNLICLSCTSIKVEVGIVLVECIIRQVHTACSQITWVWLLVPLSAKPHYSLPTKRKVQLWVSSVICIDASQFPPATPLKIVV